MKRNIMRLFDALFIVMLLFAAPALAEIKAPKPNCEECTKASPCWYQRPAGDGCNTCSGSTWCVDGKWFTDGLVNCTLASCVPINGYEILNPFSQGAITR